MDDKNKLLDYFFITDIDLNDIEKLENLREKLQVFDNNPKRSFLSPGDIILIDSGLVGKKKMIPVLLLERRRSEGIVCAWIEDWKVIVFPYYFKSHIREYIPIVMRDVEKYKEIILKNRSRKCEKLFSK